MIHATIKKEIRSKAGTVIEIGTKCLVWVEKETPTVGRIQAGERKILCKSVNLYKYFEDFQQYEQHDIEEAICDGVCPSLTGCDVEPDGWDEAGFPSLLKAHGII